MSRSATPASAGASESYSFSIEPDGELLGVGMIVPLLDNATRISWSFQGRDLPAGSSGGRDILSFKVVTMKHFIVVSCVVAGMMLL